MPLIKLPSGEVISAIVRFGKGPDFCNVSYNDITFNLDYDPDTDLFLGQSGERIPDTVVAQVNEYIKGDKIDVTNKKSFA